MAYKVRFMEHNHIIHDVDAGAGVLSVVHNSPHDVMVRTASSAAKVTWLPAHNRHRHYHYVLW